MRRRDRQNEIIVALVVAIAMGFALVFSIVLSLDDQDEDEPTLVADATRPTIETPFAPSQTPTSTPSETPTEVTDEPTKEVPSETPKPTETLTQTATNTPSRTPSPSDTPSQTPSPSDTPSRTPTESPTRDVSIAASAVRTSIPASATATNSPTRIPPSETRVPPSATNTNIASTRTTVPLVQQTNIAAAATVIGPTPTACVPRSDWEIYNVEIGDTFFSIARSYDLTVDQLAAANCIDNPSRILAGQPLRVPNGSSSRADAAIENCNTPEAILTAPRAGDRLDGFVTLRGVARGEGFRRYILDWRPDAPSVDFRSFAEEFNTVPEVGDLGRFNTDAFPAGLYWFRLRVLETNDFIIGECSIRVRFR